jgi:hypothetical protein
MKEYAAHIRFKRPKGHTIDSIHYFQAFSEAQVKFLIWAKFGRKVYEVINILERNKSYGKEN